MKTTKPELKQKFGKWEIIDLIPIYTNDSQRNFKV
jgi:hypothetical protein